MSKEKYLVGLYHDEEVLMEAVKDFRRKGLKIHDVHTPFPVHGLDEALGLRESRLHTVGFIAGATGLTLMLSFITWINVIDYPINFGGKPFFALPSFVPVSFEFTVLSASVTMVITFFARCGLTPLSYPRIFDERITDDMFAMIFEITPETSPAELAKIQNNLKETGAREINVKEFEAKK